MEVEDEVVGSLEKSELSRKSKKRKENINDIAAANPIHSVKDVGVKEHTSIEKGSMKKMKRDNDGVTKTKKTARDDAGITLSDDTNGVAFMKTEKRKRKKAATDDAGVVLSDDTNGVTLKKTEKRKRKRGVEISEKKIQENNRKDEQMVGTVAGDDYEKVKKKKKKNKTQKTEDDYGSHEVIADTKAPESNRKNEGKVDKVKKKKKKKNKKKKRGHDVGSLDGERDGNINGKQVNNNSSKGNKQKSSKKNVTFSSEVEVFPASNFSEGGDDQNEEVQLVRGKRFSKEEDQIIRQAVYNYIEMHDLGEEGLHMVLNSKSYPEVRHCWKNIAAAIPYRPLEAVYCRTQVLFRRIENHKWSKEEKELILKHQKLKGNQWKEIADTLGTHRFHVKDLWRRIHLPNLKRGQWSQDEYQNLFDLVNKDLQLRISEEKKSKHGMLRDNVAWTAISNKLSTRSDSICCVKWYSQLSSPMVAEGIWADTDDFRMIDALYRMDATCVDNVDWDNLLEHRPGEICLKRWRQMVLHIGSYASKSFSEQVEVLANRYCPSLIEAREIWDNKPVVS
ncbi:unnamed protein product [Cuscuta europaea]|uniref:Myb-like domain-containing protein n=1 Tax=Cuscuta europaea TaxID=41803 RepID=A0A9P0YQ48_CUSEU|nr:unnamed protein product [Cuscuta europaea]